MQNEKYDPLSIEKKWQKNWEQGNKFQPVDSDENFSIVIPPPNVTGSLHMGHALEHSIIDVITRVKRLQGFQTLWLPGTDHAGIITQLLVEKELEENYLHIVNYDIETFNNGYDCSCADPFLFLIAHLLKLFAAKSLFYFRALLACA